MASGACSTSSSSSVDLSTFAHTLGATLLALASGRVFLFIKRKSPNRFGTATGGCYLRCANIDFYSGCFTVSAQIISAAKKIFQGGNLFGADEAGKRFDVRDFCVGKMFAQFFLQSRQRFKWRRKKSVTRAKFFNEEISAPILSFDVDRAAKSSADLQHAPTLHQRRQLVREDVQAVYR